MEARLEALEKEVKDLKMGNPRATKEKVPRKSSAYNDFMKSELTKLKAEKPDMPHKERFKLAASNYGAKK